MKSANEVISRDNRNVPSELHGLVIVIEFVRPIPFDMIGMFHRIHLTPSMWAGGEAETYRADLFQPQNSMSNTCHECSSPTERPYQWATRCVNNDCVLGGRLVTGGPKRGIMKCVAFDDYFVVRPADGGTVLDAMGGVGGGRGGYVDAVALVLDRRYHDKVLFAVKNKARELAEQLGWEVR